MSIYKITLIGITIVAAISFILAAKVMSADELSISTHNESTYSENNDMEIYQINKCIGE